MIVTAAQVKALVDELGCGMQVAAMALEKREGDHVLAREFVQRYNLAVRMSDEYRFPLWTRHLKAKETK